MPEGKLTHLSLFSGVGGLDLAAEWAGFQTVGQCEWADYPYSVLCRHWPDVPKWRDIRTLTKGSFYGRTGLQTTDVVSGGFPCQPFSISGHKRGAEDDRHLWPEMLRVISEIKPVWVVGENVPHILNMGVENCLSDLDAAGYEGGILEYPADAAGAPFIGNRVFIIAAAHGERRVCMDEAEEIRPSEQYTEQFKRWQTGQDCLQMDLDGFFTHPGSGIERNDDGLCEGVDRLTCVGNAVNPFQAYPIFAAIAAIEGRIQRENE